MPFIGQILQHTHKAPQDVCSNIPVTDIYCSDCGSCEIRRTCVCNALSDDELQRLGLLAHTRRIAKGQSIYLEGNVSHFANIISGVVKLTRLTANGRQHVAGLQFSSSFLGSLFAETNQLSATAASDVMLCCFPKQEFEALLKRFPRLEQRLFVEISNELEAVRERTLLLLGKSALERVASLLLTLVVHCRVNRSQTLASANAAQINTLISRADMAGYLGLTVETVSRNMSKLASVGVIEIVNRNTLDVPDVRVLKDVSGE